MKRLIIFDFDGVIADSEVLSNTVLAETITELGVPTTLDDAYRVYMGKQFPEVIAKVEENLGRALPGDFSQHLRSRTLSRFQAELRLVAGADNFLEAFDGVPRCIASSSSPDRLDLCLDVLNLKDAFGPCVFSAAAVGRGKPYPDIFLHAAAKMGVDPARALVIEDSPSGVQAGVAAGMTIIGLLAAAHIGDGHGTNLRNAGAHYVANSFLQAEEITRAWLSGLV